MAKLGSKTYANALFELAVEEQMIDQILAEYEFISNSFDEFPELLEIINSPLVSTQEKRKIVVDTFGKHLCELLINFLKLLIDKKRSNIMHDVYGEFKMLYEAHKGLIVAKVESVILLEANQIKDLEAKLNKVTGKTVTVNNVINPDIMGGLVVKVGDKVIDGSIRRKLENLKHELAEIII